MNSASCSRSVSDGVGTAASLVRRRAPGTRFAHRGSRRGRAPRRGRPSRASTGRGRGSSAAGASAPAREPRSGGRARASARRPSARTPSGARSRSRPSRGRATSPSRRDERPARHVSSALGDEELLVEVVGRRCDDSRRPVAPLDADDLRRVCYERSRSSRRPVRESVLDDSCTRRGLRRTFGAREPTRRRRVEAAAERQDVPDETVHGSEIRDPRARTASASTGRRRRGAREAAAALSSQASRHRGSCVQSSMRRAAMSVPGEPHMISSASLSTFSRTRRVERRRRGRTRREPKRGEQDPRLARLRSADSRGSGKVRPTPRGRASPA